MSDKCMSSQSRPNDTNLDMSCVYRDLFEDKLAPRDSSSIDARTSSDNVL